MDDTGDTGPGDDDDDDDDDSSETGVVSDALPCDVQEFLDANCWMCHDASPSFGAPMPLATRTDFEVPATSDPTEAVHERVLARITDPAEPMPATGMLPADQRAVLEDWIADGRPPGDGNCMIGDDDDDDDDDTTPEVPCDDPDIFTASAADGGGGGFEVPIVDDLYACFVLDIPFAAIEQGTAWGPVIDDDRVVHHMLLLRTNDPTLTPGEVVPNCEVITLSSTMLMGWGPGSGVYEMPEDAGLELPDPGERLVLQIHYNNTAGYDDAVDASGFAVCTTDEPREHNAATLWLGTTDIAIGANSTGTATGDCDTTGLSEPFTMLMSWPHMHQHGSQFVTDVLRSGGGTDPVVDVPAYDFDSQIYYPHDPAIVVEPGDVLRTTCTYDNTTGSDVYWGEATDQEMCFNFATVYPIELFDPQGRFCVGGGFF